MIDEIFEQWLIKSEIKSDQTAYNYKRAIYKVCKHYKENEGISISLFDIKDHREVLSIAELYDKNGKYSDFGNNGNGTNRAAINALARFIKEYTNEDNSTSYQDKYIDYSTNNFSYEKDLKNSMLYQIQDLFRGYNIFNNNEGIEYNIEGKRIDILLESTDKTTLLAIELKAGKAGYEVFGQMSMYLGLLSERFNDKIIKGCIIAGEIKDELRKAVITNKNITLKSYNIIIDLQD